MKGPVRRGLVSTGGGRTLNKMPGGAYIQVA